MTELVYLKNDEAVCDSLQVAEKFHKEHRNVLQNIDNLIAENSAVQNMFRQSHYKADNGQSYRKFYMNRDGFPFWQWGSLVRKLLNGKCSTSKHLIRWKRSSKKRQLRHG